MVNFLYTYGDALTMKKILYTLILLPNTVFAAGEYDNPIVPNPGPDGQPAMLAEDVTSLITRLQSIVGYAAWAIVVGMLVWGGIVYISSSGNEEKAAKGKKIVTYAIIGIALILASQALIIAYIKILGGTIS